MPTKKQPEQVKQPEQETIVRIPLTELHFFQGYPAMETEIPFHGQPFGIHEDSSTFIQLAERIKARGVIEPGIARIDKDGKYEIIAGHRRYKASEMAGFKDMPFIIRQMSDEEAVMDLVDSNIHREEILPSEKAWSYRLWLEANKRMKGRKSKEDLSQNGTQKRSDELLSEKVGESRNQIQRYARLTELIPELLTMVDEKRIKINPAYELSFLPKESQKELLSAMDYAQATPSVSQAQRLKKLSQEGQLTINDMEKIMSEEKKGDLEKVTFKADLIKKYFPRSYTPEKMQETIIKLLEQWHKNRTKSQER